MYKTVYLQTTLCEDNQVFRICLCIIENNKNARCSNVIDNGIEAVWSTRCAWLLWRNYIRLPAVCVVSSQNATEINVLVAIHVWHGVAVTGCQRKLSGKVDSSAVYHSCSHQQKEFHEQRKRLQKLMLKRIHYHHFFNQLTTQPCQIMNDMYTSLKSSLYRKLLQSVLTVRLVRERERVTTRSKIVGVISFVYFLFSVVFRECLSHFSGVHVYRSRPWLTGDWNWRSAVSKDDNVSIDAHLLSKYNSSHRRYDTS